MCQIKLQLAVLPLLIPVLPAAGFLIPPQCCGVQISSAALQPDTAGEMGRQQFHATGTPSHSFCNARACT